ncbi:MAG: hypothetical protein ACHBN1_20760 [Heteroscytonema crispum UTEX LB 1556]
MGDKDDGCGGQGGVVISNAQCPRDASRLLSRSKKGAGATMPNAQQRDRASPVAWVGKTPLRPLGRPQDRSGSPTKGAGEPTTNHQLLTTNYQLPTTNYQLPTADSACNILHC